ncbi:unnamed protein product, partial [Staurois parvus]
MLDVLHVWMLVCYGPGSVGGPMRCPWYLFHRLLLALGKDTGGAMIPYCPGAP